MAEDVTDAPTACLLGAKSLATIALMALDEEDTGSDAAQACRKLITACEGAVFARRDGLAEHRFSEARTKLKEGRDIDWGPRGEPVFWDGEGNPPPARRP